MRLYEITNGPNLLLYHWTDSTALDQMTSENIVYGHTEMWIGADKYSGQYNDQNDFKDGKISSFDLKRAGAKRTFGTSMTRNQWFDLRTTYGHDADKPFRIGFNKRQLGNDYKIIPVRDWYLRMYKMKTRIDPVTKKRVLPNEFEEFVVGNIKPFWHYVDEICIEQRIMHEKNELSYLIGGYFSKEEFEKTGLPMYTNKCNVPDHVKMYIIDIKKKTKVLIDDYFGISRDISNRDKLPYMEPHSLATRSNRNSPELFWNDEDRLSNASRETKNYVDMDRRDRKAG